MDKSCICIATTRLVSHTNMHNTSSLHVSVYMFCSNQFPDGHIITLIYINQEKNTGTFRKSSLFRYLESKLAVVTCTGYNTIFQVLVGRSYNVQKSKAPEWYIVGYSIYM